MCSIVTNEKKYFNQQTNQNKQQNEERFFLMSNKKVICKFIVQNFFFDCFKKLNFNREVDRDSQLYAMRAISHRG